MPTCRHCTNPVEDRDENCPYCGRSLAVEAPAEGIVGLDADTEAEVRELARTGQKIEAIKRLRDATGLGLAEAKDLVEAMVPNAKQEVGCGCCVLLVIALVCFGLALLLGTKH
jgi:RNA polymerase subunit RPABC4/transcription elongation factor Spt4